VLRVTGGMGGKRDSRSLLRPIIGRVGVLCALLALPGLTLAGPPFQTDDMAPVDVGHYEFYAFAASDATALGRDLTGPAVEFNWGALPNMQLHTVLGFGEAKSESATATYGLLDTELGMMYRFVSETRERLAVGIFPLVELPTGDAARGLGVGRTWYRLPLWAEKTFGPWTTYGGGGYEVVRQPAFSSFPFAGWALQRDVDSKWTVGVEAYYHGAEGPATSEPRYATMLDLGGYYSFKRPTTAQLLFAIGHSVAGIAETYCYLGLYWTWAGHGAN
jgi:hypothetical protein